MVTHGYFLRTMVARAVLGDMLGGEAFRRFQRSRGHGEHRPYRDAVSARAREEPGWRVLTYNDHAHLSECA